MKPAYTIVLMALILTFAYAAYDFIVNGFSTLDLALFSLFILLGMAMLVGMGNNQKGAWFLGIIVLAFLMNYLIYLFLQSATIVRFVLVLVVVSAFIACIFAGTQRRVRPMHTLQQEKINTEAQFHALKQAFDRAAKEAEEEKQNEIVVVPKAEKKTAKKVNKKKTAKKKATKKKVATKKKTSKKKRA